MMRAGQRQRAHPDDLAAARFSLISVQCTQGVDIMRASSLRAPKSISQSRSSARKLIKSFSWVPMKPSLRFSAHVRARGFTLIEIMVVITILGILAALIVPRVVGRTDDARIAAARQDIASLMQALKLYRLDNGRYPTTEQGLRALIEKPSVDPVPNNWKQGGYLERSSLPKDPWGKEYQYLSPGLRGEIDVFSFGRDGQSGGEGPDADVGSWSI
jgi:general secretion pathway protein G